MKQTIRLLSFSILSFCLILPTYAQNKDTRRLQEIGRKIEHTSAELLRIIGQYSQQVNRNPNDASAYNNRAAAYFDNGNYREAIIDYTNALRLYSSSHFSHRARMHYKRGLCYYILGEYDNAGRDFSKAINYRPDVADSYYFRAKINYLIKGDVFAAKKDLQIVLNKTSSPSVQGAYARLLLGNEQEGLNEAREILRSIPRTKRSDYAMMCYNYSGLLALAGNQSEAVQYLRLALDYGYADYEWLIRDINFGALANNRDFKYLLRQFGMTYIAGNRAPEVVIINQKNDEWPPRGRASKIKSGSLTFIDENGNRRLDANEIGNISFKVANDGPGTASDVVVRVKELSGSFGLNYAKRTDLGDVYAGESRTVKISVQGTDELLDGEARFEVSVADENGYDAVPMQISIPLSGYQAPVLEVIDHHFASQMGGIMRAGVPAILKLAIKNLGKGTAKGVLLDMVMPQGVFTAANDKYDLGDIQPGESRVVDFEFFTSRNYAEESVELKAVIKDREGTYSQRQTFIVKVNQELEVADRVIIRNNDTPKFPNLPEEVKLISDVDVNLPRTGKNNPNAIAVVIGNRDYNNQDVPPVDYALNDAMAMKKYLVTSYGFDPNNILYLENATQADFNGIFGTKEDHKARLYNLVRPDVSDVFVFYSGHGAPDLQSEDAYFVPVDCDPSLVKFNGYAINTFYENLAKIPYKSMTVVIDACFSGASAKGTLIPRASLVRIKSKSASILTDPKAAVFTSATGTQIASWYPEQAHGLFTYYFLKGIQGEANKDRDRKLTLAEMRAYINGEVPYQARRMNNRVQTPETYGKDDSVIFDY